MDFELFYFIPWPKSQKIQDELSKKYWSFADCDYDGAGVFVNKEWIDKHRKEYGL